MSFNERFAIVLKIPSFFGLAPFRFNKKSIEFESTFLNLIQSILTYLLISVGATVLTVIFRYGNGETNLADTANVSVFSQDIVLVIAYNGAMIKWLLLRKDHIIFLNKINEMGEKLKVKLKLPELIPPAMYYKRGCFTQVAIVVFCAFIVAYDIVKELNLERLNWSNCMQTILFGTAITVQILSVFYIGFLAAVLGEYFHVVLYELSSMENVPSALQKGNSKFMLLGINLFDELICLKEDYSQLFGHLLLLILSFEFVYVTISVYFVLTSSVGNVFSMAAAYHFLIFILPHVLLLMFLVHFIHKLGDVVSAESADSFKV